MDEKFEVYFEKQGDILMVRPNARLDTATSPEFAKKLEARLDGVNGIVMDLSQVDYISSAGLRVMLIAEQRMEKKNGSMKLLHVDEKIQEMMEMTGFLDLVELEQSSDS